MRRLGHALPMLVVAALALRADAETFDMLSYTPPPGWTAQQDAGGRLYLRKDAGGSGMILLGASRAAAGTPEAIFAEEWAARAQPLFGVAAPRPEVRRQGEVAIAVGAAEASVQGQPVVVALVAFATRGRALGVLGVASSQEVLGQVTAFLDGISVGATAPAAPAPPGRIELDADVPPHHVARHENGALVIAAATPDRAYPCSYAILPARPSRGDLEADAHAAFAEVFPGWRKRHADEARNKAMRGRSAAGWPYHWYRADVERDVPGRVEYAIAMVMTVPAPGGRVSVVTGFGDLATCRMDDVTFARLFHGLRPRGWTSDGGKALARDLVGAWISSTGSGRSLHAFAAGGGYEGGLGVTLSTAVSPDTALERTTTRARRGRWSLRGDQLVIAPEGTPPSTYRVRVGEERELGRWNRALYLLDENATPPYEVQYLLQRR